jgi:hypothetical protein
MGNGSELLMLQGVSATCADCAEEAIFVPVEDGSPGEFCCTACDAAVYLMTVLPVRRAEDDRKALPA